MFEAVVSAQVVDGNGDPLADVEITTCLGERCAVAEGDDNCVSTTTDTDGRLSLEVSQCRPAANECELRPLLLEAIGCGQTSARIDMALETEQVLIYVCVCES